jgi:hypothetical protein
MSGQVFYPFGPPSGGGGGGGGVRKYGMGKGLMKGGPIEQYLLAQEQQRKKLRGSALQEYNTYKKLFNEYKAAEDARKKEILARIQTIDIANLNLTGNITDPTGATAPLPPTPFTDEQMEKIKEFKRMLSLDDLKSAGGAGGSAMEEEGAGAGAGAGGLSTEYDPFGNVIKYDEHGNRIFPPGVGGSFAPAPPSQPGGLYLGPNMRPRKQRNRKTRQNRKRNRKTQKSLLKRK